jgi:hypothetical protein
MYAISCSVDVSEYAASKYQGFQLSIPGKYHSEIFAGSSTRLQQIPIALDVVELVLIGVEYEYGVEKSRQLVSDVTKLNVLTNKDRYLFGNGYQVAYVQILTLYPVQITSLNNVRAYDLETLEDRMILIHDRNHCDSSGTIKTQLRQGMLDHIARLKEKWKFCKNQSPVTHRIEQLLNRERDILQVTQLNESKFHISHLKCNAFDSTEIQIQISVIDDYVMHPTTDEIMQMYHAMASHQFQHALTHFSKNIRQDLECINRIAASFLSRDQSAKRLYAVMQRTKDSIHDILDLLSNTLYSVKKELRHVCIPCFWNPWML